MSRTLKVVNLSNWDGEDYEITVLDYNGKPVQTTIAPGESTYVPGCHDHGAVLFRPVDRRLPDGQLVDKIFQNPEGEQVTPYMDLGFK